MPSPFDRLLFEIEAAIPCPAARAAVRRLLLQHAGERLRFNARGIAKQEQVKAAAAMLKAGMPRREIRDALMARHGIARSTAYACIRAALSRPRHGIGHGPGK